VSPADSPAYWQPIGRCPHKCVRHGLEIIIKEIPDAFKKIIVANTFLII
jgi:hypothetical protein